MGLRKALVCLALTISAYGQTSGEVELRRAQSEVDALRQQVESGLTPRIKLDQAIAALDDAQDANLLSRTLYGKDLTEDQSTEMRAAALRRLERRRASLEKIQTLVDAGALPIHAVDTPKQDLEWAEKEYSLVVTRADLVSEIASMARIEQQVIEAPEAGPAPVMERFDGDGSFTRDDFKKVVLSFEKQFKKPLPVSAQGETAVHRALGFDHRDRVDIAVTPDSQEGAWLRSYLESNDIPYYAFRNSVPGKATAAHIHIGPPSGRLLRAD